MIPDVKKRLAAAYKELQDKVVSFEFLCAILSPKVSNFIFSRRIQSMQEARSSKKHGLSWPRSIQSHEDKIKLNFIVCQVLNYAIISAAAAAAPHQHVIPPLYTLHNNRYLSVRVAKAMQRRSKFSLHTKSTFYAGWCYSM